MSNFRRSHKNVSATPGVIKVEPTFFTTNLPDENRSSRCFMYLNYFTDFIIGKFSPSLHANQLCIKLYLAQRRNKSNLNARVIIIIIISIYSPLSSSVRALKVPRKQIEITDDESCNCFLSTSQYMRNCQFANNNVIENSADYCKGFRVYTFASAWCTAPVAANTVRRRLNGEIINSTGKIVSGNPRNVEEYGM